MEERRHNDEAIIAELRGFRDLFDNKIDTLTATSERIEAQVLKTNGRVNAHDDRLLAVDKELAENRGKAKVNGAIWGIGASIITGLIMKLIK